MFLYTKILSTASPKYLIFFPKKFFINFNRIYIFNMKFAILKILIKILEKQKYLLEILMLLSYKKQIIKKIIKVNKMPSLNCLNNKCKKRQLKLLAVKLLVNALN